MRRHRFVDHDTMSLHARVRHGTDQPTLGQRLLAQRVMAGRARNVADSVHPSHRIPPCPN